MTKSVTGLLHGKTITLDEEVPPLEGQRVRVVLELVENADARISAETQAQLWREWVEQGPDGPIEDHGEAEFP